MRKGEYSKISFPMTLVSYFLLLLFALYYLAILILLFQRCWFCHCLNQIELHATKTLNLDSFDVACL